MSAGPFLGGVNAVRVRILGARIGGCRSISTYADYKSIADNSKEIEHEIKLRKVNCDVRGIKEKYIKLKKLEMDLDELRAQRNSLSKLYYTGSKDESAEVVEKAKISDIKSKITALEKIRLNEGRELFLLSKAMPNRMHPAVPSGDTPEVVETIGEPCGKTFHDGTPRRGYMDLIVQHDLADFKSGGKVAGTGFYYLKNAGALLEQALISYAIRKCRKAGFKIIQPPAVVRSSIMEACGFNPRSKESQVYELIPSCAAGSLSDTPYNSQNIRNTPRESKLVLTATGEYPLCGAFASSVLPEKTLPIKMAGVSPCFRAEGLAGSANRGLYRVHQFTKAEAVILTDRRKSKRALDMLVAMQKDIYSDLGLCYRVVNVNSEDLGAPAYRKYDLEAWIPSRDFWGEITSASNCTDYQSRRLGIRYYTRNANNKSTSYVHTLNATVCAVPRVIIAILEQFQDQDGDVSIPTVLSAPLQYLTGSECPISKLSQLSKY